MKTTRLWRHIVVSLLLAGPAGGLILGLLNAGDPDPNPIGRVVYAFVLAVSTPLHGGFPPRPEAGSVHSYNAWPHIILAFALLLSLFIIRDRRTSAKRL
ncbi:MAG: hypothetical protein IT581_08120 [Verrucomicrobiales bacterium]|nr:hypothetical protein [Verrucomicrobiales bacterium]